MNMRTMQRRTPAGEREGLAPRMREPRPAPGRTHASGGAGRAWRDYLNRGPWFTVDRIDLPLVGAMRPWQIVFFVVGLPGLVVAGLALAMREPARGDAVGPGGIPLMPRRWSAWASGRCRSR